MLDSNPGPLPQKQNFYLKESHGHGDSVEKDLASCWALGPPRYNLQQGPLTRACDRLRITRERVQGPLTRAYNRLLITRERVQGPITRACNRLLITREKVQGPLTRAYDSLRITRGEGLGPAYQSL